MGSVLSFNLQIQTLIAKPIDIYFIKFEPRQRAYTYTPCLDFMLYFYALVDFLFPSAVTIPHTLSDLPPFQIKQLYQAGNSLPAFQVRALEYRSVLPTYGITAFNSVYPSSFTYSY